MSDQINDQEPFFAEVLENIVGDSREISLWVFDQGDRALFQLYHDDTVLASEEFSDATVMKTIRLLAGMKRLREGENGTLSELSRFMQHRTGSDILLFSRLADDFGMPVDHLIATAYRGRWPSAVEFYRVLQVLPEKSQRYLVAKAYTAIKHGEVKDSALIELVESLRQKPQPQPEPIVDDPPVEKKRGFLHRNRRK